MTVDEMKRQYRVLQEQIRRLEAVRADALTRGEPVPRRLEGDLAELRISAEERRNIERGNVDPYRRTLWRLGDALDAFGCEGAMETLCEDWHLLQGRKKLG